MTRISEPQSDKLRNKKLYLACSGGVDSMVLLHLLHSANFNLNVLHVNYQLREHDSDLDEKLVKETCEKLGIPFYLKRINTKQILAKQGGNLQEFARKIRYDWFREILDEDPVNRIVLGHHQDDQVETFFQHIARKSGIIGMAGMLEDHAGIVRPLLNYTKEQVYLFARENKIEWREDLSNEGNSYTRNKLRNLIIPELERSIPSIKSAVLTLVNAFQETQQQLEQNTCEQLEKIRNSGNWEFNDFDQRTEEEKAETLRNLGIRQTFVAELRKLRKSQKGKTLSVDDYQIIRESDAFFFIKQPAENLFELCIETASRLPDFFDKQTIYLDAEKISGNLQLRRWKTGDRMKPLGVNGSKLISDILTEAKVPSGKRSEALVLTDNENIHWCVGFKISSVAIADKKTAKILIINVKETALNKL